MAAPETRLTRDVFARRTPRLEQPGESAGRECRLDRNAHRQRRLPARRAMTMVCEQERDGISLRRVRGFDRHADHFPPRMSEQLRLAFSAGRAALAARGASMTDVVRVIYRVKDTEGLPHCAPFLYGAFGERQPISTLLVVPEFERPDVEIEIDLIARLPERTAPL